MLEFDRDGNLVRTLGESAGMSFPNGVAVDAAGNVYVTDSNNGRLLVFDAAGTVVAQVGRGIGDGNLGLPRGVAVSGDGRVYVADATGQGVFVYSTLKEGERRLEYLGYFGGQGIEDGSFQFPNGLALDARGRDLRRGFGQRSGAGLELLREELERRGGDPGEGHAADGGPIDNPPQYL